nr:hypothetical protein [Tanacetum cinerariifolium]
ALQNESTLWHRRLGHVNFKNMNKLTEAVATACYVLNRVLVTKPYDKTLYELLTEDEPSISYLKPFGCYVTILNTNDPLGKFDKKSNEGYIVGYSISSKAYRVYNLVSRKIEETMNLKFLENKPFVVPKVQHPLMQVIIQSTPTPVVPIVDEATNQNDGIKSNLAKTNTDNLDELAELQALQRPEQARTEEADHLGLAFRSLNPILGVGSASISSSISAGSTPPVSVGSTLMSSCVSPISADRHSITAGKSHVSAGRPTVSAGRPSSSADRTPVPVGRIRGKFTASASSERFPRASNVELSDIHDGLKIFNCPKSGIFTSSSYDEEFAGLDANNLERSLDVHVRSNTRVHLKVLLSLIHDQRGNNHTDFQLCMFSCFLSQEEPSTVAQALTDPDWNKRDARGIVCRSKARLVAQGHKQEEGIDYSDVFTPVAIIKAIRLFLTFASFMGFRVYQMDMNSAFLYGKIAKEVYVTQLRGFEDPDHSKKVYKDFKDIMLVQVYVDDIIFGSTRKDWCEEFETLMQSESEMSSMGPLTFFLGLQVHQRPDGIFIHQEKYVADILKKFDLDNSKLASTPFEPYKSERRMVLMNLSVFISIDP